MIRHTVAFTLHHEPGSPQEAAFLREARALAQIPGVQHFEQLRQTSTKSEFTFSFSMEFAGPEQYEAYNAHPLHTAFVRDRWAAEVAEFQELDFEPLDPQERPR